MERARRKLRQSKTGTPVGAATPPPAAAVVAATNTET